MRTPETMIVLATGNKDKLRDFQALAPQGMRFQLIPEGHAEPKEMGSSFQENAFIKASFWCAQTHAPCLADDSGLCLEALEGAPGVHTRRFVEQHGGYQETFDWLQNNPSIQAHSRAHAVSVLAFVQPDQPVRYYEAHCEGTLVLPPKGFYGHGYDSIFKPDGACHTYGEMPPQEKARWNPRSTAFQMFLKDALLSYAQ